MAEGKKGITVYSRDEKPLTPDEIDILEELERIYDGYQKALKETILPARKEEVKRFKEDFQ